MKILVAYDGSEPSKKALDKAVELAAGTQGSLILLTVTEPVCPLGVTEQDCSKMDEILARQTETILSQIRGELETRSIPVDVALRHGSPEEEIVKFAEQQGVDLIVIGSHGRHGAKRFFLGSVSSRVSSHAHCSVVIVK